MCRCAQDVEAKLAGHLSCITAIVRVLWHGQHGMVCVSLRPRSRAEGCFASVPCWWCECALIRSDLMSLKPRVWQCIGSGCMRSKQQLTEDMPRGRQCALLIY